MKDMLKEEVYKLQAQGKLRSNLDKILVVTHSKVLQSISAKGVELNVTNPAMGYSDSLIDPLYYQNCEILPYYVADKKE
jgi:hypothetical protein